MTLKTKLIGRDMFHLWDGYVSSHPLSTLYHLSGWKSVIENTYKHKAYYLAAYDESKEDELLGVLPLVHLKHFIFGNHLISMPYFDMAGIISNNDEAKVSLVEAALKLGRKLCVDSIELRHISPDQDIGRGAKSIEYSVKLDKVRMLLDLPDSAENLMKSFKSKLRSQIRKPFKEGLQYQIGHEELLDDFYKVFLENMRDLGSPVHSKHLILNVLRQFRDTARIVVVTKNKIPYAASVIIGFKDLLENPWSSSLRKYSRLSPNMMLYWAMLEYACDNNFRQFDFGRSTLDEGTYKFKKQWGAMQEQLYWHTIHPDGISDREDVQTRSKFEKAILYWQKMPISLTRIFGPMIRKNIGL